MVRDPIVEEVREVRHAIERECGNDGQKFFEHIEQLQKKLQGRLVKRKPKPALKKRESGAAG